MLTDRVGQWKQLTSRRGRLCVYVLGMVSEVRGVQGGRSRDRRLAASGVHRVETASATCSRFAMCSCAAGLARPHQLPLVVGVVETLHVCLSACLLCLWVRCVGLLLCCSTSRSSS